MAGGIIGGIIGSAIPPDPDAWVTRGETIGFFIVAGIVIGAGIGLLLVVAVILGRWVAGRA